jgi:hypothetical protein
MSRARSVPSAERDTVRMPRRHQVKRGMRGRRARARGAAMVEFLIGLPLAMLIWLGIDYFRAGYLGKLGAMSAGYDRAWSLALGNDGACLQMDEDWAGHNPIIDPLRPGSVDPPVSRAIADYVRARTPRLDSYAHADVTVAVKTRPARWHGDSVGAVFGRGYVLCDEVVPPLDAQVLPLVAPSLGASFIH